MLKTQFIKPVKGTSAFKKISKGDEMTQKAKAFFTSNEPTPLYFDKSGNFNSVITAYGTKDNPYGLDIHAPEGTEIRYPISGEVIEINTKGKPRDMKGYGNYVIIEGKDGADTYKVRVAHMKDVAVKKGDKVFPYSSIGTVGNTGVVYGKTGVHSDNTVWINGKVLQPSEVKDFLYSKLPPGLTEGFTEKAVDNIKNYRDIIEEKDPELAKMIKSESLGRKIGTEAFGIAEGVTTGTGNILKYLDPTYWFSEATGIGKGATAGEAISKYAGEKATKSEQELIAGDFIDKPSEISKVAGSLIPATIAGVGISGAVTGAGGVPALASFVEKSPRLAKILGGISKSAGSTAALTTATEGRMPSTGELGAYGLIDLALGGLGKVGSKLYQSAFKTGKKTAEKYASYGTTLGKEAEKQFGKTGTDVVVSKKAQQGIDILKKTLFKEASKSTKAVSKKEFKQLAIEAANKATEGMYASKAKDELYKKVFENIMNYAPKTKMTASDVVTTLPKINASIFTDAGVKSGSTAAKLASEVKTVLKKNLPNKVKKMYPKYETLIDIQKTTTSRTLPIASKGSVAGIPAAPVIGGLIGGSTGYSQGGTAGGAAGLATGVIAPKLAGSTWLKTVLGQGLKQAPKVLSPTIKQATKSIVDESPLLKAMLNKLNQIKSNNPQ